jgi:dipeptidyl aminopeptidase/acylaminoacyl peptidase
MNDIEDRLRSLAAKLSGRVETGGVEESVHRRVGKWRWVAAARVPAIALLAVMLSVGGWVGLSRVFKGSEKSVQPVTGASTGPSPSAVIVPPSPPSTPLKLSGTIAFAGAPGLFTVSLQTDEVTKIVDGAWAGGLKWSPDGSKLAYGLGISEGHGQIVIRDFPSGKTTVVVDFRTSGPERSAPSYPTWSPDGSMIAFTTGDGAAYTVEVDGTNLTQITGLSDTGCADRQLAWSSDGSVILASRECADHSLNGIYAFGPSGADARQVIPIGPTILGISVSPDGARIAFAERRRGLFVASIDATGLTQLTHGNDMSPTWSPDGSAIAFSRGYQVWVVPAGGGEPIQATHLTSVHVVDVAWIGP